MNENPIKITKKETLKGNDGYKVFSVRIKEDIVSKLDDISQKSNRTRNELNNIPGIRCKQLGTGRVRQLTVMELVFWINSQ